MSTVVVLAMPGSSFVDSEETRVMRNPKVDYAMAGATELASKISDAVRLEAYVGFSSGGPSLDEAFDKAVADGAVRVIVVTPVMVRGLDHTEASVPQAIKRAQQKHPSVEFAYVWPFPTGRVAKFLATQMRTYM